MLEIVWFYSLQAHGAGHSEKSDPGAQFGSSVQK